MPNNVPLIENEGDSMLIKDRPEFTGKPKPLTANPETLVSDAVAEMARQNYGSVIVVDGQNQVTVY
jgi:CBS domain-containing protein